jgi:hypothetical protein
MSLGIILGDYRESRNLFAPAMPVKTLPPMADGKFPPTPPPVTQNTQNPNTSK